MEEQVKRLQTLVEHLQRKSKINNSKLHIECYEVFSECVLIVQSQISVEIANVMEKLFNLLREMLESAQSQTKPPPESKPILLTPQLPDFINALQLGSVSIIDQLGTPQQIKNYQQIPWSEYKSRGQGTRNLRTHQDVGTSTIIDYYQNCQKASSDLLRREEEMREWLEFTNDTISMLGEALSNKKQLDIEFQGKPEDLDLVISDIQFKRLNLEQLLKSVNQDNMGVQNYDNTVQFLLQHIHHIQQQTAIAIIHRYKQKNQEKEKQLQLINEMKSKIKKKVFNNKEDCRCSQYVNEILTLKNKLETIQNEILKKDNQLLELQVINEQKDRQFKMMQAQLSQLEAEKSEFKQKLDNIYKEYSKTVKKNSDRERGYVSSSSNDEILINAISGNPRTTSREQSQQLSSKQQIYLSPKDNFIIQKKTQQMERLVKLVNALDGNNQTRRLTQMQFILEQKASSQIHELADLIKDIEENDLLQNDNMDNSQLSNNIDQPSSIKNLENKFKQNIFSKNLLQTSFEVESSNDKPAIKVSIPTEQQIASSRNMSSANSNYKKVEQFGQSANNKMDGLKIVNTSPNQLTPHYPLSKAKSSQNINMTRQSSIKTEQKQQNLQEQKDTNETKGTKDQYQQTDLTMMHNIFQKDQYNLQQENEQIENFKFQNSNIKINSQQQLTTISTANFNSAGTMGVGNLNSPIQSTPNSNLASPRNQQSYHLTNVFPSPSSSTRQNKVPNLKLEQESYQNSQSTEQKYVSKGKTLKQKIYEQQEERHLNQQHRRMYTTTGALSQTISPREYYTPRNKTKDDLVLTKLQQESEDKQKEEQLFYDQIANEITEQNEQDVIQKAINRTPGYELAQEINDKILETMFGNLNRTPDIAEMVILLSKNGQLSLNEFKRFVNRMQAFHKKCGRDCNHLMRYRMFLFNFRFYLRLGFVSMKYLNKRRMLKLSKPTVLPGFK
ncbi:unnamed protein product (macronuclear) [Paramecium tetraurelia]|uniref:EF-hand domain-containing protein n=1 Tax=Paramecium tetraurelia TaxID=5888 RepID=A0C2F3_PARTE|nr:uncharacterized protein GSPATT00034448001 [Paramecium tetraurelia]CAK64970.1 unnamed protein product [Paramecium tetraurelia]|eukprot:XP_001432367.1 hypothetical protein (macronuclear) [Paramecium tetraurelia strain d4-2]